MKKAEKWNLKTKTYEPYTLPEKATCYESDLEADIQCASCGTELTFGSAYTSRQIHTSMGFGYGVCETCYQKEINEERKSAEKETD